MLHLDRAIEAQVPHPVLRASKARFVGNYLFSYMYQELSGSTLAPRASSEMLCDVAVSVSM